MQYRVEITTNEIVPSVFYCKHWHSKLECAEKCMRRKDKKKFICKIVEFDFKENKLWDMDYTYHRKKFYCRFKKETRLWNSIEECLTFIEKKIRAMK